ncbi:MAG: ABC transporter ATP-binding protein [Lautropia sp.]
MTVGPTLVGRALSKRFGGVQAVADVSIELGADAPVTTIIGPNGAGKTTLLNLLCGALPADDGSVFLDGRDVTPLGMRRRMGLGIARTFQHTGIFRQLTPVEHFALLANRHPQSGRAWALSEWLETFHLARYQDEPAENLNHVSQRLLEIGMMVASAPRVLMLDEPTAGMDMAEVAQIASVVRNLRGTMQIMIIEHDIAFVLSISDRIVVLDQGRIIASGTPEAVRSDERVAAAYMRQGHQ